MTDLCWGIDLGGTKIEGVVLPAADSAEPLCRVRVPTERDRGYAHVRRKIVGLVEEMARTVGQRPEAIGCGTPGVLDPRTNTLKNSNTTCLIGQPLQRDLCEDLACHVELANDANCFALAEARLGAGRGAATVFGIILGTGVGGGVVIDGRALYGGQGIAGEWGHIVLDPTGPQCYCGRSGCVETFLSGPHLEAYYQQLSGTRANLADIALRANTTDDPAATATIDRLITWFGRGVATVINILDPHVVVLGGGVSNIDALYTRGVEALAPWVFNDAVHTRVVRNELGDSAGVFGAAMLVA
ncbi:MAG: ROK family protein [bacterium]|nr:ROK family protein [bacterium]